MVIVAQSIQQILLKNFSVEWSLRKVFLVVLPGFVGIGQIRQLKVLVPFSMVANVFMITAFIMTLYLILLNESLNISELPKFRSWKTLPNFISMMLFTLDSIGALMPISNGMQNPERFLECPGALNTAVCILMVMYLAMGFVGYASYGDTVLASVTLNLPSNYM